MSIVKIFKFNRVKSRSIFSHRFETEAYFGAMRFFNNSPHRAFQRYGIMRLEIEKMLDTMRPMLQADGGDVDFVDYFNHVVYVKLTGACEGCPHANLTLQNGIEAKLVEAYPEIVAVRDVTLEGMDL